MGTVSERNLPIRSEGEEAGKSHGPAAGFQETDFKRSRPRRPWDPLSLTEREKQKTAAFGFEEAYRRLKRNKSRLLVSFFFSFSLMMNQPVFISTLFTMAQTRKQPKRPSTEEWIKKMWYRYTMEYYLAIKKNEIMPFPTT